MKLYAPEYYTRFKCIASRCRHSCCIGWEIDIDSDTLDYYKAVDGDFGKRLSDSITGGDCPCFTLGKDERCPFLNSEGLCDIIINLGEDALCQICRDHPRFRNYFSDRVEIGLGLCCEEAARIIVEGDGSAELTVIEDDGEECLPTGEEAEFFGYRQRLLDILGDTSTSVGHRLSLCLDAIGIPDKALTPKELSDILLRLEYMEPEWHSTLVSLGKADSLPTLPVDTDEVFARLAVYFLYRHLADSLDDGRLPERTAFCVFSTRALRAICALRLSQKGELTSADIAEVARMLSSEIEYSEENTETLISAT